jgi:hypothetical protein
MVAFFMANSMTQAPTQVTFLLKEPVNFCRHSFRPRAKPVTTKIHWSLSEDLAAFRSYDRRLLSNYFVVRKPVFLSARQTSRLNPLGSPRRWIHKRNRHPVPGGPPIIRQQNSQSTRKERKITQNRKKIRFDFDCRNQRTIQAGGALYWQVQERQVVD